MKITGIDPSLTCTSAIVLETAFRDKPAQISAMADFALRKEHRGGIAGHREHFIHVWDQIVRPLEGWLLTEKPEFVVIEGYAFQSRKAAILAELGTMIRMRVHRAGFPFVSVAPATLKKFVTGSGNANKRLMKHETDERWGFTSKSHDEIDAFGLAKLGFCAFHRQNDEILTSAARECVTLIREQATHFLTSEETST